MCQTLCYTIYIQKDSELSQWLFDIGSFIACEGGFPGYHRFLPLARASISVAFEISASFTLQCLRIPEGSLARPPAGRALCSQMLRRDTSCELTYRSVTTRSSGLFKDLKNRSHRDGDTRGPSCASSNPGIVHKRCQLSGAQAAHAVTTAIARETSTTTFACLASLVSVVMSGLALLVSQKLRSDEKDEIPKMDMGAIQERLGSQGLLVEREHPAQEDSPTLNTQCAADLPPIELVTDKDKLSTHLGRSPHLSSVMLLSTPLQIDKHTKDDPAPLQINEITKDDPVPLLREVLVSFPEPSSKHERARLRGAQLQHELELEVARWLVAPWKDLSPPSATTPRGYRGPRAALGLTAIWGLSAGTHSEAGTGAAREPERHLGRPGELQRCGEQQPWQSPSVETAGDRAKEQPEASSSMQWGV
ncbi:hypothetical protein H920_14768 [Fukomys damarensis]|uniref:Uncharacterized protein n=1 Tax=Fukomys damarensis TaxID=885580 RepID=A0A091D0Y0_FUKDA|nr:hypothetical protein H920_14768 [Fukomys damarensis]